MEKMLLKLAPATIRAAASDPRRFEDADCLKKLLTAGARASSLGIAVFDAQTRFRAVNASLAREMHAPDNHLGRTTREVVGDIGIPMEPVHQRVLSLGKAESLVVGGSVRDKPEFGYWLNHCFPIFDNSKRVQQLGLFVVNVTAEVAAMEILDALTTDSRRLMAKSHGLLDRLDQAVNCYHLSLKQSFEDLACPFSETPRKVARFRSSIIRLDEEIRIMRELIYGALSQFSIPEC